MADTNATFIKLNLMNSYRDKNKLMMKEKLKKYTRGNKISTFLLLNEIFFTLVYFLLDEKQNKERERFFVRVSHASLNVYIYIYIF